MNMAACARYLHPVPGSPVLHSAPDCDWDWDEGGDYDDVWPRAPAFITSCEDKLQLSTIYVLCLHIRIKSATLHDRDQSIDAVWDGFNIAAVIDAGAGAETW